MTQRENAGKLGMLIGLGLAIQHLVLYTVVPLG